MSGKSQYFGLTGTALNILIGALAGIDFMLFGYDQGVMGGLLDLPSFVRSYREGKESATSINLSVSQVKTFPEIDLGAEGLTTSQKNHRSTIQGVQFSREVFSFGLLKLMSK